MTESQDNTINANLTPLPDKVGVDGLEDKWRGVWDESGVYKFQGTRDRKAVYSIDTPPPTVSGHLHVGHVFSYTHTDVIARFKRMNGYDVFYPMGWDDNGLPDRTPCAELLRRARGYVPEVRSEFRAAVRGYGRQEDRRQGPGADLP